MGPENDAKTGINYQATYKLPEGVTCGCSKEDGCKTQYPCTVQWTFVTGNNEDTFPEQFWNCADLRILPKSSKLGKRWEEEEDLEGLANLSRKSNLRGGGFME